MYCRVIISLATCVLLWKTARAGPRPVGISCYTCADEPNDAKCNRQVARCPQNQGCHTFLMDSFISKRCMNLEECRSQSEQDCAKGSCAYCCESDRCNEVTPTRVEHAPCDLPDDWCSTNPCLNGGTCEETKRGYGCKCPLGYTGDNCEITLNPCRLFPCQNCGTCINEGPTNPRCVCLPWYTGYFCDSYINPCDSSPCKNGECHDDGKGGYECQCDDGFRGPRCQKKVCDPDPCLNGATCTHKENRFACECPPGYYGRLCGRDICDPNPCQNGGTCSGDTHPTCDCLPGYTGPFCETEIRRDPCHSNPCQNGGTCSGDTHPICDCPPGYTGPFCETDPCHSNPCQNGGTCTGTVDPVCDCPPPFTGPHCEDDIDPGEGYMCNGLPYYENPCTEEHIEGGLFYWPHPDPTKFVQCDAHGRCFEKDCDNDTVWDPCTYTCNVPNAEPVPCVWPNGRTR